MFLRQLNKLTNHGAFLQDSGSSSSSSDSTTTTSSGGLTTTNGGLTKNSDGSYTVNSTTSSTSTSSGSTSSSSTVSDAEFESAINADTALNDAYSSGGTNITSDSSGNISYTSSDGGTTYTSSSDGILASANEPTISDTTNTTTAIAPKPTTDTNLGINTRDRYEMERRGLTSEMGDKGQIAATPQQTGGWQGSDQYLSADLSGIRDALVAGGMKKDEAQKLQDYQTGIQSAYQRQYDNNAPLNNLTDYGKNVSNDALAQAGNMYSGVMERNAPGDGIGPPNMAQSNFAFDDTFAAKQRTGADMAAKAVDTFIPFVSPAQGLVDANQAADSRQQLLGQEMSSSDMWNVGVKSAIPGVRTVGGLLGASQYDNYGKPPTQSTDMGSSGNPMDYLKQNNIDPQSEEGQAYLRNWYEQYSGHTRKFVGGRNRGSVPTFGRTRRYQR